jgi:hypothetical protein
VCLTALIPALFAGEAQKALTPMLIAVAVTLPLGTLYVRRLLAREFCSGRRPVCQADVRHLR